MKLVILATLLGAGLGFVIGTTVTGEPAEADGPGPVVERSERRTGIQSDRERVGSSRGGSRRDGRDLVEEARIQGSNLSVTSRARLMKWILELDAGAFPEVLEELKDLRGFRSDDPFVADPNLPDYLMVALSRWYELEGAGVLDWVLSQPEVLEGGPKGPLIQELIQEGYARDPGGSFQLLKRYAEAMEAGTEQSGISDSWFYQVGRWSRNVEPEFDGLLGLVADRGLSGSGPDDPFANGPSEGSERRQFIRGMLDAGREEELRVILAGKDPAYLEELENIRQRRKYAELRNQGWQALRDAIDRNEIEDGLYARERVFEMELSEDREEAIEWFLDRDPGEFGRAGQIQRVVISGAFPMSGDSNSAAVLFLKDLERNGEPVKEAWQALAGQLVYNEQYDELERLRPEVSGEVWNKTMSLMMETAISRERVQLGGGAPIHFLQIREDDMKTLERFGLQERALQRVASDNQVNLERLHQILGFGPGQ